MAGIFAGTGPDPGLTVTMTEEDYRVFVLDEEGKPLMPTTRFGKVRRMLKDGRAKLICDRPFTIQLAYAPETHVVQQTVPGIDPGRTNIGLCAVRDDGTVLFASEVQTRNAGIVSLMRERKMHRQASRRGERLARKRLAEKHDTTTDKWNERKLPGYEKPIKVKDIRNTEARFNNRRRPEDWLTPTATQLLRTHENLVSIVSGFLPIKEVAIEASRFAFMKMENPNVKGSDYQRGPKHGFKTAHDAVRHIQEDKCLLCGADIDHIHHVVPESEGGANTIVNLAGLCQDCHDKVHKDEKTAARLARKMKGSRRKHAGVSVLNQITPFLADWLEAKYPGHVFLTDGVETSAFRKLHNIVKTHAADAFCIASAALGTQTVFLAPVKVYPVKQYRRHDRARIYAQTTRIYKLDGKIAARNRKKATHQKEPSLEEWFAAMVEQYGRKEAEALRSRLTVSKSCRRYNNTKRMLPGAVFMYKGTRHVLKGQLTGGAYYTAEDTGNVRYPAKDCRIIRQHGGLVFL